MAEFPALPLWTDAWVADTHHLTRLQRGTYHDLLVLMWRTPGCRVPNDDQWLCARMHMNQSDLDNELKPLVKEFCRADANWITQKRLTREYNWVKQTSNKRSVAAKRRWEKEKSASRAYAPTPTPTPTEEERKKPVEVRAASPRAARWGADQVVSSQWMGDAQVARLHHGLTEIDVRLEAEKFANYWSSKSGAQATKLDWHKTWINWILKAEAPRNGRNGKAPTAHDKFFAAGLRVIEKLTGDQQPRDDHAEGDGADEAGRALPPA